MTVEVNAWILFLLTIGGFVVSVMVFVAAMVAYTYVTGVPCNLKIGPLSIRVCEGDDE